MVARILYNVLAQAVEPWAYVAAVQLEDLGWHLEHLLIELMQEVLLKNVVDPVVDRFEQLRVWRSALLLG